MLPFPFIALKPLTALLSYATGIAYLLTLFVDNLTGWSEVIKAAVTGLFTLAGVLVVMWLRERISKRDKSSERRETSIMHLTDGAEALAKLSAVERADYLARLESFYQMERQFYQDRDRQNQATITMQKELIEAAKTASEQLRFLLREGNINSAM